MESISLFALFTAYRIKFRVRNGVKVSEQVRFAENKTIVHVHANEPAGLLLSLRQSLFGEKMKAVFIHKVCGNSKRVLSMCFVIK